MNPYNKWRVCDRKKGFETKAKANKVIRKYGEDNFKSYECPICFMWHIAHYVTQKPHSE